MLSTIFELPSFIFQILDCGVDFIALVLIAVQYMRKGDDDR